MHYILYIYIGNSKSTLTHYSGDYGTFVNTVAEQKIAQARLKVAYEKEKEKLREFISREGKKYDNPAHQAQVIRVLLSSLWRKYGCYCIFHSWYMGFIDLNLFCNTIKPILHLYYFI